MKLRRNKKGFTIVELVIVIAVIGILAAVLIPTFVNLNNKANRAADESLVKNLNTALAMQEQELGDTKNNTLHDAVEDLKEYGYLLPNLVTKSEDKLLWNQETNRFILDKDITDSDTKVNFWRIQDSIKGDEEYSIYAGRDFKGNGPTVDIVNVKVGFDVGYHDEIETVNYANTVAGQEVRIRTAGGTLNIGTSATVAKGRIHQYGPLDKAEVYTEKNSFHSHGVVQYLDLKAGKAVADEDGVVYVMKASSDTEIAEENGGVIIIPSNLTSEDIQTNDLPEGYEVTATGTTQPADIASKIAKNQGLLGSGTAADPFQVYNYETMQKISLFYEAGFNHFKVNKSLTNNGTIDCSGWTPVLLNGSFDGNDVALLNVDQTMFKMVGLEGDDTNLSSWTREPITLSDFTVDLKCEGSIDTAQGLVRNVYGENVTYRNIKTTGTLISGSNGGMFFCYTAGNDCGYNSRHSWATVPSGFHQRINVLNCSVETTIYAPSNSVGVIGGHYCAIPNNFTIIVDNVDDIFTGKFYNKSGKYHIMNGTAYTATSDSTADPGEKTCTKIADATITKGANNYTTTAVNNTAYIKTYISAQLSQTGTPLNGITMTLAELDTIENTSSGTSYDVLSRFETVDFSVKQPEFDAYVNGTALVAKIGGNTNYDNGKINLVVLHYNSSGELLASKSMIIAQKANIDAEWAIL